MILNKVLHVDSLVQPIYIKPIFDIHIGTKYTDYDLLKKHVKLISQTDNMYFFLGGDMCEFITRKDKRYTEEEISSFCYGKTDIAKAQMEYMVDIFKPIMHKCLAVLKGNHETSIENKYERSITSSIIEACNISPEVLSLGYGGFVTLSIIQSNRTRYYVRFYLHHGFGSGRKKGSSVNLLEDSFANYDADCILMGHRHVRIDTENVLLRPTKAGIEKVIRPAAFCGTYRNEYVEVQNNDNYVLRAGYAPTITGGYMVELDPLKQRIKLIKD